MIYGYVRISTHKQSLDRQKENILRDFPTAYLYSETFTGTTSDRPKWKKLLKVVKEGDTIVFDSVSRMSRNADEGTKQYFDLYEKGINLIFLKEHYIDTSVYYENLKDKIELIGTDEDEIFKGLNNYFRKLAIKQIRIAFEQAEKEVQDMRIRTIEGMKINGAGEKISKARKGNIYNTPKSKTIKEVILKHSKYFGGSLNDKECILMIKSQLGNCTEPTYYKYKKQLLEEHMKGWRGDGKWWED